MAYFGNPVGVVIECAYAADDRELLVIIVPVSIFAYSNVGYLSNHINTLLISILHK